MSGLVWQGTREHAWLIFVHSMQNPSQTIMCMWKFPREVTCFSFLDFLGLCLQQFVRNIDKKCGLRLLSSSWKNGISRVLLNSFSFIFILKREWIPRLPTPVRHSCRKCTACITYSSSLHNLQTIHACPNTLACSAFCTFFKQQCF